MRLRKIYALRGVHMVDKLLLINQRRMRVGPSFVSSAIEESTVG